MAAGGLVYSAISIYRWAEQVFHIWTFAREQRLNPAPLVILVVINGVSAAVALQAKA
jgi:hypothetical protein